MVALILKFMYEVLIMKKDKRIKVLQILGIIALTLLSLKYLNDLFGHQIDILLSAINTIIFPLGVALFISYLLSPIVEFFEKKLKVPYRWLSISIVFVIMGLAFGLFVYLIGDLIYSQAVEFFSNDWDNISAYIDDLIQDNAELQPTFDKIKERFP